MNNRFGTTPDTVAKARHRQRIHTRAQFGATASMWLAFVVAFTVAATLVTSAG